MKDLVLQLTIALQLKGDVLRDLHVEHIACIILYISYIIDITVRDRKLKFPLNQNVLRDVTSRWFIVLLKIACFILPALSGYQYWHLTANRRFVSV